MNSLLKFELQKIKYMLLNLLNNYNIIFKMLTREMKRIIFLIFYCKIINIVHL